MLSRCIYLYNYEEGNALMYMRADASDRHRHKNGLSERYRHPAQSRSNHASVSVGEARLRPNFECVVIVKEDFSLFLPSYLS